MFALQTPACPGCEDTAAVSATAGGGFWSKLFDTSDFPARWNCGTWDASLGWLHIGSDVAIWAAYLAIPILLLLLVRRHGTDIPVKGVGLLFCAFILSCGTTHLFEAVIFYWPAYRVAGLLKLGTAIVSIATVVVLARILPQLLQLRGPVELKRMVDEQTVELRESREACSLERDRAESADRAKTRFLATMSHELRTPLAAILGHVELLTDRDHPLGPDNQRASLETIHRSAEHQLAIINDVLELSKIEAGELELVDAPFDPDELGRAAVEITGVRAKQRGNTISYRSTRCRPDGSRLVSDPTRVRQVLVNLLSNAAKFTSRGSIEVEFVERSDGDAGVLLEYTVRDTGIGMSAEQVARVFDPYRQAESTTQVEHGGTGLGLSISREIARALRGDLVVESTPDEGSAFTFTMRAAVETRDPEDGGGANDASRLDGRRVLLVEDQYDLAVVTKRQLERVGAVVDHAADGSSALEHLDGGAYDLVLLDLQLPDFDGDVVLTRAREAGWTGPVVALTANAMKSQRDECLAMGFDDFASKPLRGRALVELVARHADPESGVRAA